MTYRSISAGYIAVVTNLTESDSSFFYGQIFFFQGSLLKLRSRPPHSATIGTGCYKTLSTVTLHLF